MSRTVCRSGSAATLHQGTSSVAAKPLLQSVLVLLLCLLPIRAYAENIKIPAAHIGEDKTLRAQWFAPEAGKASGAAAILLHGCGGLGANGNLNARHKAAKDWLLERGINA